MKVINISDFPHEFQDKIAEKMNHCGGTCSWYAGDGYFKPLSEVRDLSKIHFQKGEDIGTKNVYVYEEGDDPIGDWLMKNHKIKLTEEVLIK